jgi:hypothetical protein
LNPSFDYSVSAFYLTCEGNLISSPDTRVLTGPSGANKLSFSTDRTGAASCTRNSVTKQLTCSQDGSDIMYIWQPEINSTYWAEDFSKVVPREDADLWVPAWMLSDSYAPGDLAHSFVRLSKLPPASNVLNDTQFVGGKYSFVGPYEVKCLQGDRYRISLL